MERGGMGEQKKAEDREDKYKEREEDEVEEGGAIWLWRKE
jgi:hypothetical protein